MGLFRSEVFVEDVLSGNSDLFQESYRVSDEAGRSADVDLAGLVSDQSVQVGRIVFCRVVLSRAQECTKNILLILYYMLNMALATLPCSLNTSSGRLFPRGPSRLLSPS